MNRRLSIALAAALLLSLPVSASAERPDSHAPLGAHSDWLPAEEWVMERWLPFEVTELERIYGVDRTHVYFYLRDARDGDRTLLDLARDRGIPARGLTGRLLATRRDVSAAARPVLVARTRAVLSQGHLAEHMLGHVFHHTSIWSNVARIWGLTTERYEAMDSLTQAQRAAKAGVSPGELRARLLRVLGQSRRRGVALEAVSRNEAGGMRALLMEAIDRWIGVAPDAGKAAPASAGRASLCRL